MRIASFHSINGMVPMIILTQKHQILKAASHNLYLVTGFVSYYRACTRRIIMRLLIIRHGDPDYEHDSLTEQGRKEAEYLSEELCRQKIDHFYVSPYGRAKDTDSYTLDKMNRTAEELPWLKEFDLRIRRPDSPDRDRILWDWLPQDWTEDQRFYQKDHWFENEYMTPKHPEQEYKYVTEQFDELLKKHGYRRERGYYIVEKSNKDTIAFFCHFGLGCVLLSHLWGVSPMILWHNMCAAPTSITTLVTEERRQGAASFRMLSYGAIPHLNAHNEEPSFAARFCECFDDDTRHD